MLDALFNSPKRMAVKKSLDAQMLRVRTVSNNIANVSTPGFKRSEVSFEGELRKALDNFKLKGTQTNASHMRLGKSSLAGLSATVEQPNDAVLAGGINNVDIDDEMSRLAESQIMYNYGIKFASLKKLDAAIAGRQVQ